MTSPSYCVTTAPVGGTHRHGKKTHQAAICFADLFDHLDTKSFQQRDMSLLYTGMSIANKFLYNTSYNFEILESLHRILQ